MPCCCRPFAGKTFRDLAGRHRTAVKLENQQNLAPRGMRKRGEDRVESVEFLLGLRHQARDTGTTWGNSIGGRPDLASQHIPIGSQTAITAGSSCARFGISPSFQVRISTKNVSPEASTPLKIGGG